MRLPVTVMAMLALATPANAEILQNDSAEVGRQVGFYPRFQGGTYFETYLDVPDDLPEFQVCAVRVWIGPNDFNVFSVDIFEADDDHVHVADIYRSDLDAFQVFGSQAALNDIDLRDYFVESGARHVIVRLTHAEGFAAPPSIAFDDDGITPMRNRMSGLMRDGTYFNGYTEELPEEGLFPRPPGDWILRLVVVGVDDICPEEGAVVPDGGVIVQPPDEGRPPPPPIDAAPKPDREGTDARLEADAGETDGAAAPPPREDARPDEEAFLPGELAVLRVSPDHGPAGENTAILIDGRGFPEDGDVDVIIGDVRALDVVVESERVITAVVPSNLEVGVHDLEVVRGDGESDVLVRGFTVSGEAIAKLEISAVLPASVVEDTLPTLTLLGRGFADDAEFFVGPVMLQGVEVSSGQRATAILSTPLPPGIYPISVRVGDEQAELAAALTVLEAAGGPASDGCDCRAAGADPGSGRWVLLSLGGLLALRRNRRRR